MTFLVCPLVSVAELMICKVGGDGLRHTQLHEFAGHTEQGYGSVLCSYSSLFHHPSCAVTKQQWHFSTGRVRCYLLHLTIDILYTLDSASNYSAIQKLKP
jgi:hypothetical protein